MVLAFKQKLQIILAVLFSLSVPIYFFFTTSSEELLMERIKGYNYSSTVVKMYRNKKNHNFHTIELKSGINVPDFTMDFYNSTNLSDSIVKLKNDTIMTLYKNDTIAYRLNMLTMKKLK